MTAVEYLFENYLDNPLSIEDVTYNTGVFEQAKEMEKEQGYSEEEVKRLAFDFYYDMSHKMGVAENLISENATNVDIWFKQFKKK